MRTALRLCLAAALLMSPRAIVAGTPAPGWADELVFGGLTAPTGIAFFPGASPSTFLVIEKGGSLKLVDPTLPPPGWALLGTLSVCTAFEMGLLGIAVDPDFDSNHFVYLYRTEGDGGCAVQPRSNEVIRVTLTPLLDPASLVVLLGGIRTFIGAHNGGGLRLGPEGALYVGVGENALGGGMCPGTNMNPYAQDPNVLEGKVLRINRDGSIPIDNPFVGVPGHRAEVFAFGFRNPWRFGFDPLTGRLWLADVGQIAVEEIDIVTAGGNYGWPHCEGPLPADCAQLGDVAPIYAYRHAGTCTGEETLPASLGRSITGGAFAGALFGALANAYVFGDFGSSVVYLATPNATRDGIVGDPVVISTNAAGPVDVVTGPDGAIYYVAINTGEVRRVAPQGGQLLPGRQLRLKIGNDPARKALFVESRDPSITLGGGNGSNDDPVQHGGSVRVRTTDGCGGPCDDTYALPSNPPLERWSYVGDPGQERGYRYRSKAAGLRLTVRAGRELRVRGRGPLGHQLGANPQPVDVTVATGSLRYCLRFGGQQSFAVNRLFSAKNAIAPAACAP